MAKERVHVQQVNTIKRAAENRALQPKLGSRATLTRLLLIAGVAVFAFLVWNSGPELIGKLLLRVGWETLPLVILPHTLVIVFETSGWWFAFPRNGCPITAAKIARFVVAAKAIQLITPSISQAGELLKIHLLRFTGLTSEISVSSVIAAKTTITLAELLFLTVGLAVVLTHMTVEPALVTSATVAILMMCVAVAAIVAWQRMGLFRPFVWLSRRLGMFTAFRDRYEQFMSCTDALLRDYLNHRTRLYLSGIGYFLAWFSGVLEAWVFLSILGLTNDFLSALLVQVWLVLVTRVTAFIPGNVGAHEAGIVMMFSFLGLGADSAMAFALLRRIRQIVWIALGMGLLAKIPRAQRVPLFG
ncbi:MAG: lysylphosphatidylglycerol synthase transmembrane domain-containing protein [Candidatus Binatia bacterium]